MRIDRLARVRLARLEVAAAVAGGLVVLVVAVVLSGQRERAVPRTSSTSTRGSPGHARRAVRGAVWDSRDGAVTAATRYLVAVGDVGLSDTSARRLVNAIFAPPLRSELAGALPVALAQIRRRLTASRAPASFGSWPLGYRLVKYEGHSATVALWHLEIGASSAVGLMSATYTTTTYMLKWSTGTWRVRAVANTAGPKPPPADASPAATDAFARAVTAFARYGYAP
jgi:hypothetical protein